MPSSDEHGSTTLSVVINPRNKPEPQHRYEPGGYHPVNLGEVYNLRYEVIRKLGWGLYSTVWLVRDTQTKSVAALKILVAELSDSNECGGWDEIGVLKVLREGDPKSFGYYSVCQLLDDFTHQGPIGTHICLVLEPMVLNVQELYLAYPEAMPVPLLKLLSQHLLYALHYIHKRGVIHTDIKGDNILMFGTPPEEAPSNITLSGDDLLHTCFKLSDFGAANMMSNRFAEVIQPESLRAPEVIIGAEWDTTVDIWNLGCLLYEFATGGKLFDPHWDTENSGMSPTETHLAQIVGLCGEFTPELLAQGTKSKLYFNEDGSLLQGADKFSTTLDILLDEAGFPPEEAEQFSDFLFCMLFVDPKLRWPPALLANHPWLDGVE